MMKSLFLATIFFFFFSSVGLCRDELGFMWLEQVGRGRPMSSSAKKHGADSAENGKKMAAMAAMMKKAAKNNRGQKKKKRPAMSRPAKFFLKAGRFRAPGNKLMPLFLADTYCTIQVPDGSIHALQPEEKSSGYRLYDEALAGGFYQLFAYNDIGIRDGIRYYLFSQYRFRNYGKDETVNSAKKERAEIDHPGFFNNYPRFRLVDVKGDYSNERYADIKYTGDNLVLRLFLDDEPLAGVAVTVTSSRGWQKTAWTDQEGKVEFILIKEIFHDKGVNKAPAPYLVTAEYTRLKSGTLKSESFDRETFRIARHFSIRPSPLDWKSRQLGFLTIAGTGLAVMLAAGVRRRRRMWYESR